ncbi:hypothetical protein [Streptomyces vinaceus]|uniref:hypothetical protein n=1 Tax=Streptomyces vinaceus TaxID=1960 RepID=UPI0036C7E0AD
MGTEADGGKDTAARLERWRELFAGTAGERAGARRVRVNGETNVLSGVWLHAAARAEQGLELTPFEEQILTPLREVLGEEEVFGIGRVYRDQVAARAEIAILPRSVTSRSLKDGFTRDDYAAAVREIGPLVAALPNVARVDRSKLAAGEDIDTEEFKAAAAEYGHGITVFTGEPDDERAGALAAGDFRAQLEFRTFDCHKAAGDQGGGKDEIYWTAASNSTDYQQTTRTGETGSVVAGKRYNIAGDHLTDSKAFFDTTFKGGFGSTVITAWEADQSSSAWYAALGQALTQVVEDLKWHMHFLDLIPGMDAIGHLYNAVSFITTFWESWRNNDDLILSRGFAFSRADLAALYHAPNRAWRMEYDAEASRGMGNFTLEVGYAGAPPVVLPTPVRYKTLTGNSWTDGATPGWQAAATPALASYNGSLYAVFPRQDKAVMWSRLNGTSWSSPQQIKNFTSYLTVGLAVHNNRLYCVHIGENGTPHWNTFDGSTWSNATPIAGRRTTVAPALASHGGKLWMIERETTARLQGLTLNGSTWSNESTPFWSSDTPPSAVSHGDQLNVIHKGVPGDNIHLGYLPRGTDHAVSDWHTNAGPAITRHNNQLVIVHRDLDGNLRHSRGASNSWERASVIPGSACLDEPALASHDGKLHLMYRVG